MGSSRRVGEKKGKLNDMCRGVGYGVFLLFNDFMVFLTNPRFFQFNKQIIDFLFLLVRFLLHEPPSFFVCESNGFFKVLWIEFFDEDIRSHGSSKLVVVELHFLNVLCDKLLVYIFFTKTKDVVTRYSS